MPPSKHAVLSASGAHRWLHCNPSARLELEFADRETEAAAEGTAAHALAEHKLKKALKIRSRKPVSPYDCDEMDAHTDGYVEFVLEQLEEAKTLCADPLILIEQRLDFSCYVPDGFGTGDCLIVADKLLHIIDFKYGQGVLVDAEENPQMMLYALGALRQFDHLYDITQVAMSIYQPRRENVSTWTITVEQLMDWAEHTLKPKAEMAYQGEGDYVPGPWCTFCKAAVNLRDVETEMSIQQKLSRFPVSPEEWDNYHLDQRINDRGILLDRTLVAQAIRCDEQFKRTHLEQARSVTGLENPNSPAQLKAWLMERGVETDSLSKASVQELLSQAYGEVELALSLRQELAKSSVKKYTAMESVVCSDDRARGLIQFYGANRTGRFAGRLIQVQNLPQNHLPDLKQARTLVRDGHFDALELLYDSVPLVLSELIRTAFIPKPGCRFFVADFSAIEARIIAWIAGEQWRQDVFAKGGDIYCASASQMFHVPVVKHGVNGHLRQKGKIAELALGYGGSVGALKAMGALNYGLTEEELKPLVDAWRQSNPRLVKFWWDVDRAAATCVRDRVPAETHGIRFLYQSGMMFIVLPSGRKLVYVKPKMGVNRYGSESVTYEGVGEQKKWLRLESYGPKFVENIVQATARDILVEAMRRLEAAGYQIVMHVHDEAVIEAPADSSLEDICAIMGQTPAWAGGLLLRADGYVCDFYQKD